MYTYVYIYIHIYIYIYDTHTTRAAAAAEERSVWGEEQEAELRRHLDSGFLDWGHRDFIAFKNAVVRHGGREAKVLISRLRPRIRVA
jgi:hypothetical protein